MPKYKIYTGLNTIEPVRCNGIYDFNNLTEATNYARHLAIKSYEVYSGYGLPSWNQIYEKYLNADLIDITTTPDDEIINIINEAYYQEIQKWIVYYAVEDISPPSPFIESDDNDTYDDDDVECYCE